MELHKTFLEHFGYTGSDAIHINHGTIMSLPLEQSRDDRLKQLVKTCQYVYNYETNYHIAVEETNKLKGTAGRVRASVSTNRLKRTAKTIKKAKSAMKYKANLNEEESEFTAAATRRFAFLRRNASHSFVLEKPKYDVEGNVISPREMSSRLERLEPVIGENILEYPGLSGAGSISDLEFSFIEDNQSTGYLIDEIEKDFKVKQEAGEASTSKSKPDYMIYDNVPKPGEEGILRDPQIPTNSPHLKVGDMVIAEHDGLFHEAKIIEKMRDAHRIKWSNGEESIHTWDAAETGNFESLSKYRLHDINKIAAHGDLSKIKTGTPSYEIKPCVKFSTGEPVIAFFNGKWWQARVFRVIEKQVYDRKELRFELQWKNEKKYNIPFQSKDKTAHRYICSIKEFRKYHNFSDINPGSPGFENAGPPKNPPVNSVTMQPSWSSPGAGSGASESRPKRKRTDQVGNQPKRQKSVDLKPGQKAVIRHDGAFIRVTIRRHMFQPSNPNQYQIELPDGTRMTRHRRDLFTYQEFVKKFGKEMLDLLLSS